MVSTQVLKSDEKDIKLQSPHVRRLFRIGLELADLSEEILEQRADYQSEFLTGLKRSLRQAKSGNLTKIESLREAL